MNKQRRCDASDTSLNAAGQQPYNDCVKLVVIGDSCTGKTSMLYAYTKNQFLIDYQTTILDNYSLTVNINQRRYFVNLFDTAGQEDYAHLRVLSYPQTDVFLLCFSMIDVLTLEACRDVWAPEIWRYSGAGSGVNMSHNSGSTSPVILLVGTKEDLWNQNEYRTTRVESKYVQRIANEIGCIKFLACSSLTHRGLKRVFDEALIAALARRDDAGGGGDVNDSGSGLRVAYRRLTSRFEGKNFCSTGKGTSKNGRNDIFNCCSPL